MIQKGKNEIKKEIHSI